jgi:hypothetical protein
MAQPIGISPAFETQLGDSARTLQVTVVFTSPTATAAALRKAGALAERLRARIVLLMPQIVPWPLPLESPPVLLDFTQRQLREIAESSPVQTTVCIYLCRDATETLRTVLAPRSLVVIGAATRWWLARERRLARQLRRAGHEVIVGD